MAVASGLIGLVVYVLDVTASGGMLGAAESGGTLHDIDRSGWWQLLVLIPLVGAIILIVWLATPPRPAGVTRDAGYQAQGYGGYPQGGPYGGPDSGQYGQAAHGSALTRPT